MSLLDSIADYLEDNSIGTVGTDIFTGELPFDKTDIISLLTVPSPEPDKSIPYFVQVIDIWARFKAYDTGYQKLQDIFDLIHQAVHYDPSGYHVYLSYALGLPEDLDRDIERRHLFKLSLGFIYRKSVDLS